MVIEYSGEVLDVIKRVEGVKSFRLARPDGFNFRPGQWMFAHLEVNGKQQKKPLSFSSSPTERDHIEFTKRLTGSDFSKKLDSIVKGDKIKLVMPYGTFTFEGELGKIALLSGGIGITPFRSISRYAADKALDTEITLIYGNSYPDRIIFKDDLDALSALNPLFKVVYTITSPEASESNWKGWLGRVSPEMVIKEIPDYQERVFYICGPPGMVDCLIHMLKNDLNISPENIRRENFTGYA